MRLASFLTTALTLDKIRALASAHAQLRDSLREAHEENADQRRKLEQVEPGSEDVGGPPPDARRVHPATRGPFCSLPLAAGRDIVQMVSRAAGTGLRRSRRSGAGPSTRTEDDRWLGIAEYGPLRLSAAPPRLVQQLRSHRRRERCDRGRQSDQCRHGLKPPGGHSQSHGQADPLSDQHPFPRGSPLHQSSLPGSHGHQRPRRPQGDGSEPEGPGEARRVIARPFSDVDLTGSRYSLQDMTFSGNLSFHHGEREVRVLDLGEGHSESDVVVHLPTERIVFCGDVFTNEMPPLPGEGHRKLGIDGQAARTVRPCQSKPSDDPAGHRHGSPTAAGTERAEVISPSLNPVVCRESPGPSTLISQGGRNTGRSSFEAQPLR